MASLKSISLEILFRVELLNTSENDILVNFSGGIKLISNSLEPLDAKGYEIVSENTYFLSVYIPGPDVPEYP
jgi:hypothetical protein